jgi:hypothetical protein
MVENVSVEKGDLIAAYMTTAHVASSYKVESTKTIVDGWNKFRQMAQGWDDLDFLATLLSLPSVFGTAELNPDDENALNQVVNQIGLMKEELTKENISTVEKEDLAVAFLTNASVAHSKGLSSRKATIQQYQEIKGLVKLEDNRDMLASFLTISRIMDVKKHPVSPDLVKEMFDGMRSEVEKGLDDSMRAVLENGFGDNLMATCSLTAAYIEISPKVEKYKDIMQTWSSLLDHTLSPNPSETISVVLFSGKIRDLDSMHLLQLGNISDQITSIKQLVESHMQV